MRAVVQRVKEASVVERGKVVGKIKRGLLVYLAIAKYDTSEDIAALVEKVVKLRIFPQKGKLHDFQKSVKDIKGEVLVIPNYTLFGDLTEGNRPFFGEAAAPKDAMKLYDEFLTALAKFLGTKTRVKTGTFGEFMEVSAVNDGPATLILETDALDERFGNGNGDFDDDYSGEFDDLMDKLGVGDLDI